MVISPQYNEIESEFSVEFQNLMINPGSEYKYSGIIMEPSLNFQKHIHAIESNFSRAVGIL